MLKTIVIGAGLGGLAAACRLARLGCEVTVVERNDSIGGKVNRFITEGYSFDTGASLVTMKHVFEELFDFCESKIEDRLKFREIDPICRYNWSDGTVLDASSDLERTERQIAEISTGDAARFREYLDDSRRKFEIAERTFLAKSLNELPTLIRPRYAPDLARISAFRSLSSHNERYFESEKLRQLFDRFATYSGSSPYKIPATFSLIPHVEFGLGAWYVDGGIYKIPLAIESLAGDLGVEFRTGETVSEIVVEDGAVRAVRLESGEQLRSESVVANADAISVCRELISDEHLSGSSKRRVKKMEPSMSGFVLLLGVNRRFDSLAHHNIFFSDDYRAEFENIFEARRPADDPTIYVSASSRTDPSQAPSGCENLFVLVNAPYTDASTDWNSEKSGYRDLVLEKLESFGLTGLGPAIEVEKIITPEDFERKFRANRGSIYGASSNGLLSAFFRMPNRSRSIAGLYFVGGTTHPGGGMPLVLISARLTAELIENDFLGR